MKNFKKVTAAIAATLMAATMVAPMALSSFAVEVANLTEAGQAAYNEYIATEGNENATVDEWLATIDDAELKESYQLPTEPTGTANGKTTFTLKTPELPEGATLSNIRAVKIFNGSYADSMFSVSGYGTDVKEGLQLTLTKLFDADATEAMSASDLANALSKDTTKATAFAKAAANALKDVAGKEGSLDKDIVTFEDLGVGYYVVLCDAEGKDTNNGKNASVSLGMLTVTGADKAAIGNGEAKIGLPTVDKKIKENQAANYPKDTAKHETSDKSWNDVGDYNIGETVSFKLYGTLPQNLADYDTYFYQFNDSLGSEFDIAEDATITVKIDGEEVSADCKVVPYDKSESGKNEITVTFEDIKSIAGVTAASTVTVEYDAVLSSRAGVGLPGQQNEVYLKYSNNPNNSGAGQTDDDHGETPKKKVIAFTYAVEFEKTFWNGDSNLTADEIKDKTFNKLTFTLQDEKGNVINVVKVSEDDEDNKGWDYYIAGEGETGVEGGKMTLTQIPDNDSDGIDELVIRIKGLDEGKYKIVEDGAIAIGYNNVTSDVTITATTGNTQEWTEVPEDALTQFDYTFGTKEVTQTKGNITGIADGEIMNKKGINLPSTGGIGTTLFYLGGGAMVAVAGVFLITKKRMGKEEA